jgi:alcohol dehydrogenase class IV
VANASFRHLAPATRIFYGDDCLQQLPAELGRVSAKRAVVFSGRTLANATPGLGTIQAALGSLYAGAFTGVVEQSPLTTVEAGVEELRRLDADAVIALGGGSAVVTARAAAIVHGEARSARELCTVFAPGQPPASPKLGKPKLPQFVVPTTPTTAYAKTGAAVTLPGVGRRLSLFDPKARAQAIFFKPDLISATPDRMIVDAGMDAFAQGIQGLESTRREPLADALLLHGVRLIRRFLSVPEDPNARTTHRGQLMVAAQLIGEGTDYTGAGAASAIGHAIGARFSVGNGAVKSIVLPHMVKFNAPATRDRLNDVVDALGVTTKTGDESPADAVSRSCRAFFDSLGLPSRLRDLQVPHDALVEIADDVLHDWFFAQNPRPMGREDLIELLEAAW